MVGKDFGGGKVFQVLMICDHVDRSTRTFEEVSPDTERSTLPSPTDSAQIQVDSGWNGRNGRNLVGMSFQSPFPPLG